jgi:hypothetical protein
MMEPLVESDPLRIVRAWVRLVIWKNAKGEEAPHVNVASNLQDLLQANLQPFDVAGGQRFALYLTDYSTLEFRDRDGDAPWGTEIAPPPELKEVLDAMKGVR